LSTVAQSEVMHLMLKIGITEEVTTALIHFPLDGESASTGSQPARRVPEHPHRRHKHRRKKFSQQPMPDR
jgi:hypothetical protein